MSTVQEIEKAIEDLPPSQFKTLLRWVDEFREQKWDSQIERDAKSGKFRAFKKEIAKSRASKKLLDFP